MAKVTMIFEDTENGTVIASEPGLSELLAMANHPKNMTDAQIYALESWSAILKARKHAAPERCAMNPLH